jgi:ADP-ribosylglycohydrolase
MKYSLLSRFRGALLGSLVGETLVCVGCQERLLGGVSLTSPKPEDAQTNQTLSDWSQLATCGTESLIRCGKVNLEDWWLLFEKTPSSLSFKSAGTSSEAAVATLPIALFFHEDQVKLRQQLLACADVLQHKSEAPEAISVVAYAIALALTEKLDVATLIPQTLDYLGTSQTPLKRQLEQVHILLEQGAGLDTTLTHLRREAQSRGEPLGHSHISIALAFYCFLATPEDFRLGVSRAARSQYQPQITAALTGALAGAYNSIIGIPVGWRLAANRISSGIQRLQLADRLLEVWAGVYDVPPFAQGQLLTVAAPRVIQPR